jgi:WD40 repeat protein
VFKKWIAEGLLENSSGKAVAASGPALDFSLKSAPSEKPDGPPPMPKEWPAAPLFHTARKNAILGLCGNPWSPLIAVAGQKQVLLYQSDALELIGVLPFMEGQPDTLVFSRNGRLLLAAGGRGALSGRVVVWDVVSGTKEMTLGKEGDAILSADLHPDQSQVAFGGPSRLVKIVSTKTGEVLHKIKKHTDWVTAVGYSPNGQMLASADRNGGISIWDPENAQELFTLPGHKGAVTSLSWRSDSKFLASSSEDGTVKFWEMKEGRQAKSWIAHALGVLCVQFSHDGRLATCGRDNLAVLWEGTGSKIRTMESPGELPLRVAFSFDDQRIFGSGFAGDVICWSAKDGKKCGVLDTNPTESPKQLAASGSALKNP